MIFGSAGRWYVELVVVVVLLVEEVFGEVVVGRIVVLCHRALVGFLRGPLGLVGLDELLVR